MTFIEIDWLRDEYEKRRAHNPYYSRRVFSRFLGLSPGRLSELLSRKRLLTPKLATRLVAKLNYSPERQREIVGSVHLDRKHAKALGSLARKITTDDLDYVDLPEDTLRAISEWYHLALLNLTLVKGFQSDPLWIARELGISINQTSEALWRLERLGLLKNVDGVWRRTKGRIRSSDGIPSQTLRAMHKQHLELAALSLENKITERDISSITMAVNSRKLEAARRIIKNFRRSLSELMETGERDTVYNLSIALFPLSKRERMSQ